MLNLGVIVKLCDLFVDLFYSIIKTTDIKVSRMHIPIQSSKLFEIIFKFPLTQASKEQWINSKTYEKDIKQVNKQLKKLFKDNQEDEIDRVCISNGRLVIPAELLRNDKVDKQLIITMFGCMATSPKMIDYLIKLNVPVMIYFLLVRRIFSISHGQSLVKPQFASKNYVIEGIKFIFTWTQYSQKSYPRLFADLIYSIFTQFSSQLIDGFFTFYLDSREKNKVIQFYHYVIDTAILMLKKDLKLAAESGILLVLFEKVTEGQIKQKQSIHIIEIIINYYSQPSTRPIISEVIDFGRFFSIFTNVDKTGESQIKFERVHKLCEFILSCWPTIIYFLNEKSTFKFLVQSMKGKPQEQLKYLQENIIGRMISRVLRYDKKQIEKCKNSFLENSNSLNYKGLIILYNLVNQFQLFQTLSKTDKKGKIIKSLSQVILQYYDNLFQRYHRTIINHIDPNKSVEEKEYPIHYIQLKSYFFQSILPFGLFNSNSLIAQNLLFLKGIKSLPDTIKFKIDEVLKKVNENKKDNNLPPADSTESLQFEFYNVAVQALWYIPWDFCYLNFCKYLSEIAQYLYYSNQKTKIIQICKDVLEAMVQPQYQIENVRFKPPQNSRKYFYKYLIITVLDDYGKLFGFDNDILQFIEKWYNNHNFSCKISRFLAHIDYDRSGQYFASLSGVEEVIKSSFKRYCDKASEEIVIQVIELIKRLCLQIQYKFTWGIDLISEDLIYRQQEEIATAATQFFEEMSLVPLKVQCKISNIKFQEVKFKNLRKRLLYLAFDEMIKDSHFGEKVNKIFPNFLEGQLQAWFKTDSQSLLRKLSANMCQMHKKYSFDDQKISYDFGLTHEQRRKLAFLPWNVKVNDNYYIAFAQYKLFKQRMKLRSRINIEIQQDLQISINIGSNDKINQCIDTISKIKLEDISKIYIKSKKKINERFNYNRGIINLSFMKTKTGYILQKIVFYLNLSKDTIKPLDYPINFISQIINIGGGFDFLKKHHFVQKMEKIISTEKDPQIVKGALFCLGFLLSSDHFKNDRISSLKFLESRLEVIQNLEIKQVIFLIFNILVKDSKCRNQEIFKNEKKWVVIHSKYASYICFPLEPMYKFSGTDNKYSRLDFIKQISSQRQILGSVIKLQDEGYRLIHAYFNADVSKLQILRTQNQQLKQIRAYFRANPQALYNPNLLNNFLTYISLINFPIDKIGKIVQIFWPYLSSDRITQDFPHGIHLL